MPTKFKNKRKKLHPRLHVFNGWNISNDIAFIYIYLNRNTDLYSKLNILQYAIHTMTLPIKKEGLSLTNWCAV